MPWELDFAELTFEKLSFAKKYINPEDTIYIQSALNLSDYILNWKESTIPKSFFIEKYNNLLNYLEGYNVISNIYDKNELYGHLDLQRESLQQNIDYYISICPDMYFHNHLLFYMIDSAKKINDKYFIITSETTQLWDYTWDDMVNKNFKNVNYNNWNKQSPSEIVHFIENNNDDPFYRKTHTPENRIKMSLATKGKLQSREHIKNKVRISIYYIENLNTGDVYKIYGAKNVKLLFISQFPGTNYQKLTRSGESKNWRVIKKELISQSEWDNINNITYVKLR